MCVSCCVYVNFRNVNVTSVQNTLLFIKFDVSRAFIFSFNLFIDGVRLSRVEKIMFA